MKNADGNSDLVRVVSPTANAVVRMPSLNVKSIGGTAASGVMAAAVARTKQAIDTLGTSSIARPSSIASMLPKYDIPSILGKRWASSELPVLAIKPLPSPISTSLLSTSVPKIDVARITGIDSAARSMIQRIKPLNLGGALSAVTITHAMTSSMTASLQPLFDIIRGYDWAELAGRFRTPDNWSDEIDDRFEALVAMVNDEGIPAAWVPRTETLLALLDAAPGDARSAVLIEHREEILEDCGAVLSDIDDAFLADVMPLAHEVLDSCKVGHWRVAALAAVPIVHGMVESLNWVYDRQRVAKHHRLSTETPLVRLLEQATRAPLILFYEDWNPKSGRPRPRQITRHVVSHWLGADQVTERNCIVAVMLMSSLLVTVSQLGLGQKEIAA